jgi:cytidyltransferase-like protein
MITDMNGTTTELGTDHSERRCLVSGCFDLLHSGHVEFLRQAATFGRVTVAIGSDATIIELKGRKPACNQQERSFMLRALRCVDNLLISRGSGLLDFEPELRALRPDAFVVNDDGDHPAKKKLCADLGIEYHVLKRQPAPDLPSRSTSVLRANSRLPYRLDLAGGWLDQPFVSSLHGGSVIVVSLGSASGYAERSGMGTSTRATVERIYGDQIPQGDLEDVARIVFCCENPPWRQVTAGSQDALGIVLPGLNRLTYEGGYWPTRIDSCHDPETIAWLQSKLYLKWLGGRPADFQVLKDARVSEQAVIRLANAADDCWKAIQLRDVGALGMSVTNSYNAQVEMFPAMTNDVVTGAIQSLTGNCLGYKLAGAGGPGYVVVVADDVPQGFEKIEIRRETYGHRSSAI